MVREDRSPRRSARPDYYDRDRDGHRRDRDRDYEESRRRSDREDRSRRDDGYSDRKYRDRSRDRRRDREDDVREGSSRGYKSSGRDRDADYDDRKRRDERGGSSRRSASPRRRSSKPRSPSRAGSKARSKSPEDKAKPNFAPSGLLAAETKKVKHADGTSTVLKYHEPPEARKPSTGWRLYVFKGSEQVDLLHIYRQSAYLFGRDRAVVDVVLDHPSCSKQHAVIQFRQVNEKNEFGDVKAVVKPFIIDLESTNGTHVNGEQIPTSRYFELKLSDVIKFGESQREYVLLSEDAA
ncbi:SMAD/FHA domain-containing protein [Panus rudis PR-1116 ss-1]|nr:SMAD/FHA domain-containing protein [Panus rudis PR-1116 ss-1]